MVSNSAQLDRRTKQHTQFGVSASNGSRDITRTKSWRKKKEFFFLNEHQQSHIASPTGIANYCAVFNLPYSICQWQFWARQRSNTNCDIQI